MKGGLTVEGDRGGLIPDLVSMVEMPGNGKKKRDCYASAEGVS